MAPVTVFTNRAFHPGTLIASAGSLCFDLAGRSANPWHYLAVQAQLDKLSRLAILQAGWNDGRGVALSVESLTVAAELAHEITLAAHLAADISPTEDGGLVMEWERGERGLQIEILPTGASEFALIRGAEIADEGTIEFLQPLTDWLTDIVPACPRI